jgi:hypothetical protein
MPKPTQPPKTGNGNKAPTSLSLSNTSVPEERPGAPIGILSADDKKKDIITFMVDDPRFEVRVIDGLSWLYLKSSVSLDYETLNPITVNVTATDQGGLSKTQNFLIKSTDVNEAPTDIVISKNSVTELEMGAVVGTLSGNDEDGDLLSFSVVGSSLFQVVQDAATGDWVLKLKDGFFLDYVRDALTWSVDDITGWVSEEKPIDVTLQVSDGQLTFEKTLKIDIIGEGIWSPDFSDFNTLYGAGTADSDILTVNQLYVPGKTVQTWSMNGQSQDDRNAQDFTYFAGGGNDSVNLSSSGLFVTNVDGGKGNDILIGSSGGLYGSGHFQFDVENILSGGEGDDVITVIGHGEAYITNYMYGGLGADIITGGDLEGYGTSTNNIYGGEGNDVLAGGNNSIYAGGSTLNVIHGGNGNDIIKAGIVKWGGPDEQHSLSNELHGDSGADTFVFLQNDGMTSSTIYDFESGEQDGHDFIDLSDYGFESLNAVLAVTVDSSDGAVIQLDANNNLTLQGNSSTSLVAANFRFDLG